MSFTQRSRESPEFLALGAVDQLIDASIGRSCVAVEAHTLLLLLNFFMTSFVLGGSISQPINQSIR